ncbi:MAG TPA: pseudouridine synthase [Candidatus Binatia bacterium]|nr:pseudouridine synthase [Candidatus Binatia bacterium]
MASRRTAEDLIRAGRVRVNGKVVRELGTKAHPTLDRVTIDGRPVRATRLRYIAYHKPVGVVSTMDDPAGRPAIGDVVRGLREHVFPVGRLDFDSSGLLLLTNDGELAQRLTHPRYKVAKVYRVKVRGHPSEEALERLRRGVRLEDGVTAPAEVAVEQRLEKKTRLRIALREGRSRQVRRMCEAVGHPVDRLSRIAVGPIRLGSLPPGELRDLTAHEVLALRHATRGGRDAGGAGAEPANPVRDGVRAAPERSAPRRRARPGASAPRRRAAQSDVARS